MNESRQHLLVRAFRVVPGVEFNRARRALVERGDIVPVTYEARQPELASRVAFRDSTLPPLVCCRRVPGIGPGNPTLRIMALFFRDHGYFLEGPECMNGPGEQEGLNGPVLHFPVLRWLSDPLPSNVPV